MSLEFHFLNERPENCNIICNSNHSNKLGILGSNDNPMHDPVLYLGDQTEMWSGSSIILSEIPDIPIHLKCDGIIVDLTAITAIKDPISFGLPTCDCCPLLIMDEKGKIALVHISTETLSLYKTAVNNEISNSQKTPVLHQIFSVMEPKNCIVWIGPCIKRCCYEFGKDDAELLTEQTQMHYPGVDISEFHYPHCDDKVYVDFPGIITAVMVSMGVSIESIITEYCSCTVCGIMPKTKEPWQSYRRSGNTNNHNWLFVEITSPESNNSIFSI